MIHNRSIPPLSSRRVALGPALLVMLCIAATAGLLAAFGRADLLAPALVTAAACSLAALVGLLPLLRCRDAADLPALVLGGMTLRLMLSFTLATGLALITPWSAALVGSFTLGWYLLLLVVEVAWALRFVAAMDDRSTPPAKETAPC